MAIIKHPKFLTNFPAHLYDEVQAYIIANDVPICLARTAYDGNDNLIRGMSSIWSTDGKRQDLLKFWQWYESIGHKMTIDIIVKDMIKGNREFLDHLHQNERGE